MMTTHYEKTRAQVETHFFLQDLLDPSVTPRVPKSVREFADYLLRDYPRFPDSGSAHKALTKLFGTVPPLQRIGAATTALGQRSD